MVTMLIKPALLSQIDSPPPWPIPTIARSSSTAAPTDRPAPCAYC